MHVTQVQNKVATFRNCSYLLGDVISLLEQSKYFHNLNKVIEQIFFFTNFSLLAASGVN